MKKDNHSIREENMSASNWTKILPVCLVLFLSVIASEVFLHALIAGTVPVTGAQKWEYLGMRLKTYGIDRGVKIYEPPDHSSREAR